MLELEGFGKATKVSLSLEVPWEVQKCSAACVFHLLFQLQLCGRVCRGFSETSRGSMRDLQTVPVWGTCFSVQASGLDLLGGVRRMSPPLLHSGTLWGPGQSLWPGGPHGYFRVLVGGSLLFLLFLVNPTVP